MDFWNTHPGLVGFVFLVCAAFFPRLTMLFAVATPFGVLHWLGWIFAPHLTVAIMATTMYWDTNPVLCVISWICALGGTGAETRAATKTASR